MIVQTAGHQVYVASTFAIRKILLSWQAPRQSPTPKPEADLPAFAYGPGASTPGAFTAWAAVHENWVGTEHLFALLRLSGTDNPLPPIPPPPRPSPSPALPCTYATPCTFSSLHCANWHDSDPLGYDGKLVLCEELLSALPHGRS